MKFYFFSFALVALLFGCRQPAPTLRQTLQCYVRYDAAAGRAKAEAALKEGPDEQHLTAVEPQGGFQYQGATMELLPIQGMTFSTHYNSAYQAVHHFNWKDKAGKPQVFEVRMPHIDSFYFKEPALSVSKPATLFWTGGTLEKGETLVLLWQTPNGEHTKSIEVYNPDGINALEIPATKMSELSPGTWSLYLVRKRLTKSTVGAVEATGVAEFYSPARTFSLAP